jgi:isopentenyl-diphosphate Delta-isomerase
VIHDRAEDQLILVDRMNRVLAPLGKRAVHERGLLHRAFSIFLVDRSGRILLQQRHPAKYHSGELWANTCCGHPRWGETIGWAAHRRLFEELGISTPLEAAFRTHYEVTFENGLIENEAVTVLFGLFDGQPRPDPSEISTTKFMSLDELHRDVRTRPSEFAYWLRHYLRHHRDELKFAIAGTVPM